MSEYGSDDTYNVIAEHVIEALQADPKLGTGGDLEVKTWEQEPREDASLYDEHELPAVSVTASLSGEDVVALDDRMEYGYQVLIEVVVGGGVLRTVIQDAKKYAARVERVMRQQHLPDKQMSDLPADLDGGVPGSVEVSSPNTVIDGGAVNEVVRGVAITSVSLAIEIDMPED